MQNKTALITGGTSGVGLSLVRELSKMNYDVFFIGTNKEKGQEIESEINENKHTKGTFIALDLSDILAVKNFAQSFKTKVEKLDLLANIAGIFLPKKQETKQGFDKVFAVGYLSAYILSTELESVLAKAENPRITNVAGESWQVLKPALNLDDLNFKKDYSGMKTTVATVHAKTVLSEILTENFKDSHIMVNSFHPGIIKGNLSRNMPFPFKTLFKLVKPFMSNVSKSGVYACTSPELNGVSGKLIVKKKLMDISFKDSYKKSLFDWTVKNIALV
jgi:NAD(P)-dependent dehydrogenase (short-subunit alcohol dehydrogenase family)